MRTALVTEELSHGVGSGGIGGAFHELALLLARAGHHVDVFYAPANPAQADAAGLHGYYAGKGIGLHPVPIGDYAWNTGSPEARSYAVFRHLRSLADGYDAIHFHDYKGLAHFCLQAKRQGIAFPAATFIVGVHGPTRWALEANGHLFSHEGQLKIDFMERASHRRRRRAGQPQPLHARLAQAQRLGHAGGRADAGHPEPMHGAAPNCRARPPAPRPGFAHRTRSCCSPGTKRARASWSSAMRWTCWPPSLRRQGRR